MAKSKIAKALTAPIVQTLGTPNWKEGLSSGSTLLNLACSGKPHVAFIKGHYYFLVGDSSSGKSFLSLTCLAEANLNEHFKDYRFIYDNAEDGALMDIKKFFGAKTAARIEPPRIENDLPVYSSTVQDFYYHLDDAEKAGRPFIYILDSMDALSSQEFDEKFNENKNLSRKGKEVKGSYGDGKAKANSSGLRRATSFLSKSGSILIIVNQTRDNVGTFTFEKKTRSGGHAQKFYASMEMWSKVKEKLKRRVNGKDRIIGSLVQVQIKKNRLTGQEHKIDIPIYFSAGFDDIGSCILYLIEEGHWKQTKDHIDATEFDVSMNQDELIAWIEEQGKEKVLREIVNEVWSGIEAGCLVKRKSKYE
jgi:RecA/RadA recombinase